MTKHTRLESQWPVRYHLHWHVPARAKKTLLCPRTTKFLGFQEGRVTLEKSAHRKKHLSFETVAQGDLWCRLDDGFRTAKRIVKATIFETSYRFDWICEAFFLGLKQSEHEMGDGVFYENSSV